MIDFDEHRWERIKENAARWWAGELERPLIQIIVDGHDPGRDKPDLPFYPFASYYDMSIPASDIIDRLDYELSCKKFLGDSFPMWVPSFGAGVTAAFIGARLENTIETGTVWFHPVEEKEITDLHFEYDPDNKWLVRLREIHKAGLERWEGNVLLGMPELCGALDILSVFRPSEKLLYDLHDYPDEVKRLTWEIHELWWKFYDELADILAPVNPGYSDWSDMYSAERSHVLQCDFCYMIGPDMFDEFVKPELAASCARLDHAFYHLDGPGQVPHADSLLTIPELKGVNWIPGRSAPDNRNWPKLWRKIRDAGKLMHVYAGEDDILDVIVEQLGSGRGIVYDPVVGEGLRGYTEAEARALLEKYGIE